MRSTQVLQTIAVVAVPVSAWQWSAGAAGPCAPPYVCNATVPPSEDISNAAGRSPNLTGTADFAISYDNGGSYSTTFTWRVNVSSIAVPNDWSSSMTVEPSGNHSEGLQIASTEWELQWPGPEETLQDYLGTVNLTGVSVNIVQAYIPPIVLSYFENIKNGDCSSAFGDECRAALASQAGSGIWTFELAGCRSYVAPIYQLSSTVQVLSSGYNYSVKRGDAFFYQQTVTYPASNLTLFNQTAGLLQLMILKVQEKKVIPDTGIANDPVVLCQVLKPYNATAAAAAAAAATASDASSPVLPTTLLWTIALLGGLAVLL